MVNDNRLICFIVKSLISSIHISHRRRRQPYSHESPSAVFDARRRCLQSYLCYGGHDLKFQWQKTVSMMLINMDLWNVSWVNSSRLQWVKCCGQLCVWLRRPTAHYVAAICAACDIILCSHFFVEVKKLAAADDLTTDVIDKLHYV